MKTLIYEFDNVNVSSLGWSALMQSALDKIETELGSLLRYPIGGTETVISGEAVCLISGEFRRAVANGGRYAPCVGLTIEGGIPGEYVRARARGEMVDGSWSFAGSGELYLHPTISGEITQTKPGSNVQTVGISLGRTKILIACL